MPFGIRSGDRHFQADFGDNSACAVPKTVILMLISQVPVTLCVCFQDHLNGYVFCSLNGENLCLSN
ncbi:MAG: hypothetical protein MAG451_00357 [Anaerolineales bacterium]|nr:hypothetical protein [Anaerolineales bacterium]